MRVTLSDAVRVPLDGLNPDRLARLRARFTRENPAYWEARRNRRPCRHVPRELVSWTETDDELLLPRGAWHELAGTLLCDAAAGFVDGTVCPPRAPLAFHGELRDYQREAVDAVLASGGGVVVAPTGSGKTMVALGLVARVPTPALLLVHTNVLLRQTAERVRAFLGTEPSVLGAGSLAVGDVTVATVQALNRRGVDGLADRFGLVLLDEAHHCPAYSFRTLLAGFRARYRVGLTATPERKDGLHPVLFDVVGPVVHAISRPELEESSSILRPTLVAIETDFRFFYRRNWAALVTSLTRNEARNHLVVETVAATLGQRSLVTSERIEHAELLAERLAARLPVRVTCVHGRLPREVIQARLAELAQGDVGVVVATTSLVGEGFDLPDLDTLYVTVPHGSPAKAQQLVGRILRPSPGKAAPRVVDFADVRVPVLRSQWTKRKKVYEGEPQNPRTND